MQTSATTELKVGDMVYFQDGSMRRSMRIRSFHDYEDSATIVYASGAMEIICRRSELRLKSEVDAEEKRDPYLALIEVWESGVRKEDEISVALKISKGTAKHHIKKALEAGYIKA